MNIKAKLFAFGEERDILYTDLNYRRFTWENGKPTSALMGGAISIVFDAQMYDDYFIEAMLNHRFSRDDLDYHQKLYKPFNGKIVFYEDNQDQIVLFEYNFKDAVITYFNEEFHREFGARVSITVSPAMQDYRFFENSTNWQEYSKTRYMLPWKESYIPPRKKQAYNPVENNEPNISNAYYEDLKGNKIEKIRKNKNIILVIKSKNMVGKNINIDLSDDFYNFEFEGKVLKNDKLLNYKVTSDIMKINLKTIKQN